MPLWTFDRHDRLADARDHARAILDALAARRRDAVRGGDADVRLALDSRIRASEARYRCLCRAARAARRSSKLAEFV